jgi:serine-type D-Ala-D-Ala carboxypeptidase/endopeptidase (penicillin-binding protein 4)
VSRSRLPTAARLLLIIVLAAAAVAAGFAGSYLVREKVGKSSAPPPPPTPAALRGATSPPAAAPAASAAPPPARAAVARALAGVVQAGGLGSRLLARVVDVQTGTVLYDRGGATPTTPASTAKLLTAGAVLTVRPPSARITTRVVAGAAGAIVLVGGGDPTLTAARPGKDGPYRSAARISDLAAQLRRAHVQPTKIVVDGSLYSGPPISPAWAPEDVPSIYASAITAVMTDGGRAAPGDAIRSSSPDLAAGQQLAKALGDPQLPVSAGVAPAGARRLATVSSAPLGTLVEQMLQGSDNVIAEALARQVAIAEHQPASFAGGAAAVEAVLKRLGVDPGPGLLDGSGLADGDRVSAASLAGVMRLAASSARPGLHAVVAGLPVAGWSGTLADRFIKGSQRAAAGLVRAKTGTLTGVSTLAGTVHDRSGRLLAFALVADRTQSTESAETALDAIATRLAACGCG